MKNLLAFGLVFTASVAFAEAKVEKVLVHQQWPWSREVRVDFEMSGVEGVGVDLAVEVKSGGITLDTAAVSQAIVKGGFHAVKNGYGSFAFDPAIAFATGTPSRELSVKLTVAGAADPLVDRVEYRIIDLEPPYAVKDLTRRDFYDRPGVYGACTSDYSTIGPDFVSSLAANETFVWTGVNDNDAYKTTKLVLKRIPAGGVAWTMGPSEDDSDAKEAGSWKSPSLGESRVEVQLSKDYFIGVFELTQRQYELMTGERPSYYTNMNIWATRPVEQVALPYSDFVAKIASLHDFSLKIPTEAQWEFATRAGYSGAGLPNGKERTDANFGELEGYSATRSSVDRNSASGTCTVGAGCPNAFGLFNTLGNVTEWVAEEPRTDLATYYASNPKPVVDPQATQAETAKFGTKNGLLKGGNYTQIEWKRYAARYSTPKSQTQRFSQPMWGWRVVMDAN